MFHVKHTCGAGGDRATTQEIANMATGPRVPSAQDWADKMVARAANAGSDWVKGSLAPRKDPVQAALAANAKRIARFQQSVTDKTWEGAMARVDQTQTAATITAVGAQGYANGVQARKGKIAASITRLQPLVAAHVEAMDKMPVATDADAENKMLANVRGMRKIGVAYKTGR
jgi:hypothetical protein